MSQATRFFRDLIEDALLQMNTAMPCIVISYNESEKTAKVQPLFMSKEVGGNPEPLPVLEDIPVLFQRYKVKKYSASISGLQGVHGSVDGSNATIEPKEEIEYIPHLEKGNVVLVVFAQRALDHVLDGNIAYPEIKRHHDLNDAVIVGLMS